MTYDCGIGGYMKKQKEKMLLLEGQKYCIFKVHECHLLNNAYLLFLLLIESFALFLLNY